MPNKLALLALGAGALVLARIKDRAKSGAREANVDDDDMTAPKVTLVESGSTTKRVKNTPQSIPAVSPLKARDASATNHTSAGLDAHEITADGIAVTISTFGATIVKLKTRSVESDAVKNFDDIVLGYDDCESYDDTEGRPYFGAVCGRVANRIAKGEFKVRNKMYTCAKNNGENTLHGGVSGWDRKRWTVEDKTRSSITLSYVSMDMEEGFPGMVKMYVVYSVVGYRERVNLVVDEKTQLVRIEVSKYAELTTKMTATTDSSTPISTVQHTYFNLHGHSSMQDCGAHVVEMPNCHAYVPVDEDTLIPTGEGVRKVDGSPFDLRKPTAMFEKSPEGYDHSFVIAGADATRPASELPREAPRLAARVTCADAGRALEVYTDAPGVHFYTGNFLSEDMVGNTKDGAAYARQSGFCLETGWFPDAVNQNTKLGASYPGVIVNRGDTYSHTLTYRFLNV